MAMAKVNPDSCESKQQILGCRRSRWAAHGTSTVNRQEAVTQLQGGRCGEYLVRPSTRGNEQLSLSVRCRSKIRHYLIKPIPTTTYIGGCPKYSMKLCICGRLELFESLQTLIDFYTTVAPISLEEGLHLTTNSRFNRSSGDCTATGRQKSSKKLRAMSYV